MAVMKIQVDVLWAVTPFRHSPQNIDMNKRVSQVYLSAASKLLLLNGIEWNNDFK
jgi:hypothetical protein